jgi:SAM-dependent methyltransferase
MTVTDESPIGGAESAPIDVDVLRMQVRRKYRDVARDPDGDHHFHTGRRLAWLLGYPPDMVDALPDRAVESFAGVANPFSLRRLAAGERVIDIGSGAGLDSLVAARQVGSDGQVVGVDMTAEMVAKARANAAALGVGNVTFREGLAEALPVADGWADTVIANGVFNLCADKRVVLREVMRILRPGGVLQFADIANGTPVGPEALRQIDLWTG